MCVLGEGSSEVSDEISDILAEIAKANTQNTRNTVHAILYERVRTIMTIENNSGL